MTTEELLKIVKERGLELRLRNGVPVVHYAHGEQDVTDALKSVLKLHRDRIINILASEPGEVPF